MGRIIDADALKDYVVIHNVGCGCSDDYQKSFLESIDDQPTIGPIRKGKWMTSYLDHEMMGVRPKLLYCSECCHCIAYPTNYCPNCGAKMEGCEQNG